MQTSKEMTQMEHIRFRAGMYIGRLGNGTCPNDGIYTLLQEALHYVVNEFCEGHGKRIEVRIEDKQTVVIRDYGRGMSLEERCAKSHHSPKMMVDMLTGVGMDAVNALSSYMDMCMYRKGAVTECHYEEGILLGEWTEKSKQKEGICISFTPDEEIFGPFQYKEDIVFALLRNLSYLNAGLEIVYGRICMKSTDGMAELLADKKPHKSYYLYPIIHFKDEIIDVAITHSRYEGEECYSFVNGLCTNEGGTHLCAFKETVASVVLELYPSDGFIHKDVYACMVGAVSINMEHPMFNSVNRWRLESVYLSEDKSCTIKEFRHDFFYAKFKEYLLEHKDVCDIILERISTAQKHRIFAEKCQSMSIDQLVDLWNNGIETGKLSSMELYAIRDAFLSKKVQTIEMQRSNAIGKRLKIGYDKVFNIIHCSGRFFSETSGVLLQF